MKTLGIIPARYNSSRLEGKPLLDIGGKSMIRRTYESALMSQNLDKVIVATDDERIEKECKQNDMEVMMTSISHNNGTERCAEVLEKLDESYDIVVNVQGDEPFIHFESIDTLIYIFENDKNTEIATLYQNIESDAQFQKDSIIKVVKTIEDKALYFSRSPIPYFRDNQEASNVYKHIGMYAFRSNVLSKLVNLKSSFLENAEKLEQLRWLENGYQISLAHTPHKTISIDTREDYEYILQNINKFVS